MQRYGQHRRLPARRKLRYLTRETSGPATRADIPIEEETHARDRPFHRRQGSRGHLRPQSATCSIPTPARCRPRSPSPSSPRSSTAIAIAEAAQPAWAATNPQRRARVMFKFLELVQKEFDSLAQLLVLRARQDHRRLQGRHPARPRSGRVRLRHPAPAEGRIHRERRARHRPLLDAPAARRRRRHHAVQLPGHDPDVEVRARARLRQRLHPQAVGARSRRCRCGSPSC